MCQIKKPIFSIGKQSMLQWAWKQSNTLLRCSPAPPRFFWEKWHFSPRPRIILFHMQFLGLTHISPREKTLYSIFLLSHRKRIYWSQRQKGPQSTPATSLAIYLLIQKLVTSKSELRIFLTARQLQLVMKLHSFNLLIHEKAVTKDFGSIFDL